MYFFELKRWWFLEKLDVESNWFLSNISNYFSPFASIELQIFESNEFRTNPISDNLTPTSSWSLIEGIEFELIFIEFFEYFWPFQIDRITNFRIEWISNEFWTNSNLTPSLAQTQFGFTNKGSRMHQLRATVIYFWKIVNGAPCIGYPNLLFLMVHLVIMKRNFEMSHKVIHILSEACFISFCKLWRRWLQFWNLQRAQTSKETPQMTFGKN